MTGFRLHSRPGVPAPASIPFRWQGKELFGFQGDSLAAALMANGVKTVGRSFKYHRPRGIMSAGEEEAGALVTVGEGARATPNLKATVVELEEGLTARSQNHWPSLGFDVGEVNDLLSPFLAAGFYYKTFMGPFPGTRAWMFFERFIRGAAGFGAASQLADPDLYDRVDDHCDVLVVGSGPAGLAAALEAADCGLDVVVAEQDFAAGGDRLADARAEERERILAEVAASGKIRLLTRTQVFGLYDHGVAGLVERLPAGAPWRERLHVLRARKIIAATGAIERGFVFGDNDRPGVMGAEAARIHARRFGVAPGRRVAVATTNDSAYASALALAEAGLDVTLLDARAAPPEEAAARVQDAGVQLLTETVPIRALGHPLSGGVTGLTFGPHLGEGRARALSRLDCDAIAVSGGWSPVVHLTTQARQRPDWSDDLLCFLPGPGEVLACGSAAGHFHRRACVASGEAAGRLAARDLGATRRRALETPSPAGWQAPPAPVWHVQARGEPGKAFVDPMHDVTVSDIRLAHQEGFEAPEHMKRYTTLGMAPDQGKVGGVIGLAVLAALQGRGAGDLSPTTFRPPYAPVSLGALAGPEVGDAWAPRRLTPFHDRASAAGAEFVDAGLWRRPWFFPRGEEGLTAAAKREAAMVRASVGVTDISTLGKFLVQGPDAAEFLDRIWSNLMSSLPVGRARHGFVLREDGVVLDDGAVLRLGETTFLTTASTGHAQGMEAHLSRWLSRWPDLDVTVDDATEGWCGLALAGPRSRETLAQVCAADLSDAALPVMGVIQTEVAGVPAILARISFSGERAYEIHVRPAGAETLWDALVPAARAEGGGLYGLEALDILRIEKGHLTGREIDGRMTLADLGLDDRRSKKKAFVGGALLDRDGLLDPDRPRLTGLRPVSPGDKVNAGALLYALDETRGHGLGHVSSVADSPAMGERIALGFLRGGAEAWAGRKILARDPMRGGDVKLTVCDPCFVDPEGGRMRG